MFVIGIIFSPAGKKRVKDIAEELGITPGAVSQVVDKLVRDGVLDRCTDAEDRRSVVITLSEQGREVAREIDGSFGCLMTRLLQGVPPEKLLIFNEVLQMMQLALATEKNSRLIK
ncbi:MAG: MarR family transcriptional regulator [Victivallaceae bacterium]